MGALVRKLEEVARQGGTLLNVLSKAFPLLPGFALRKALKNRDIKVNDTRVSQNVQVQAGDKLLLYTDVADIEIPVVYEDMDCLILNKPQGINTDEHHQAGLTLIQWAALRSREGEAPQLVHRLDNQTSGLLIVAKGEENANKLKAAFSQGVISKAYDCIVWGEPTPAQKTCHAWLQKDAKHAKVAISLVEKQGAKPITTAYQVLMGGSMSRLQVHLVTGRTHQIRAHLAFLGHPVMGDEVYGNRQANRQMGIKRLMLCATNLSFPKGFELQGLAGKQFQIAPPF